MGFLVLILKRTINEKLDKYEHKHDVSKMKKYLDEKQRKNEK